MGVVAEILPDVTGIDRTFSYLLDDPVPVGTVVRVRLHGRSVRGWVVALGTAVPANVVPQPVTAVVSAGPPAAVVELCRFAARRWVGRLRPLLVAASPERIVDPAGWSAAPPAAARPAAGSVPESVAAAVARALEEGDGIVRLPPAAPRQPVVEAALAATDLSSAGALVLVESTADAVRLAAGLERAGWPVARHPAEWERCGGAGRVVVGTRNAVFAPGPFALVVVLDAHSEAYRSQRSPTVDARILAAERARREKAAVLFVTPCPPLELLESPGRRLVSLPESLERSGWGALAVLDTLEEDPAEGGYPSTLVGWIREAVATQPDRPAVCVLNRTGRARLLACRGCRSLARCERCGAALAARERPADGELGELCCPRCEAVVPALCAHCGGGRFSILRAGVSRAREQLAAVTGLEVGEVAGPRSAVPATPVLVGTEAVLHRVRAASIVCWLDFDQQLLAPRFRAAEEALVLLARSVRLTSGRRPPGLVVVRTSLADHEVVRAARRGDPGLVATEERLRRRLVGLPPYASLARLDGEGAPAVAAALSPPVVASQVAPGRWVARAPSAEVLADALGDLAAAAGGVGALDCRVEVEPIDL